MPCPPRGAAAPGRRPSESGWPPLHIATTRYLSGPAWERQCLSGLASRPVRRQAKPLTDLSPLPLASTLTSRDYGRKGLDKGGRFRDPAGCEQRLSQAGGDFSEPLLFEQSPNAQSQSVG